MILGYNTNGFAHHRWEDALAILAELGYQSVALTLDHHVLNPFGGDLARQIARARKLLQEFQMRSVIETGARFLLDPRHKHQPTLISPKPEDRRRRFDFLCQAVVIAREMGADAVSFWSGTAGDQLTEDFCWQRLIDGCQALADFAEKNQVRLAFEPEPGMFIDSMTRFAQLREKVAWANFGLTLDIGHLHCQGESMRDEILRWGSCLWNVHIEDMRRGIHDHLMFGEGEIDFPQVFAALREVKYQGGIHVELSRHSHDAVQTARKALDFLRLIR